jgi:hypothetical protein
VYRVPGLAVSPSHARGQGHALTTPMGFEGVSECGRYEWLLTPLEGKGARMAGPACCSPAIWPEHRCESFCPAAGPGGRRGTGVTLARQVFVVNFLRVPTQIETGCDGVLSRVGGLNDLNV